MPSLQDEEIARQLALLINQHNKLNNTKGWRDILNSKTTYVIETHGKQVIGACGIHRQSYSLSEVKHLVVRPQWRGKGLGRFLVKKAIGRGETPILYATVREDNLPSLKVFTSTGFTDAGTYSNPDHKVRLLIRVVREWKPKTTSLFA